MTSRFQETLETHTGKLEQRLTELLSSTAGNHEIERPERLLAAMRHSVLNGGKRLRPFLVMETAALFDVPAAQAIDTAAALEFIHCYSLVHDDLPAMDDDDLRRGQPTTHKMFDEPTAILAGDALLTMAFQVLSSPSCHESSEIRTELISLYAACSGIGGMAGGQMLDLQGEQQEMEFDAIATMQSMKTGALITCACEAGAILGKASADERTILKSFGKKIGRAFQLTDDLLDLTSNAEQMGKATGKDDARGKQTLVSTLGVNKATKEAENLADAAVDCLVRFGQRADILRDTARFIVSRTH